MEKRPSLIRRFLERERERGYMSIPISNVLKCDIMTKNDLKILGRQTPETLARWYCELNAWEWPKELPDPEPKHFPSDRRGEIIQWIMWAAGAATSSREWNRSRFSRGMTDEEWQDFWAGEYCGDEEALTRHHERIRNDILPK
jgi:hypothetical protein